MSDLFNVKGISKRFPGTQALDNVDFNLGHGEVHAVVGENGAGKSTLMNIISGVLKADAGEMYFEGEEIHYHDIGDAMHYGISHVHQEKVLCPEISIAENIFMGQDITKGRTGVCYKDLYQRAQDILEPFSTSIDPSMPLKQLNVSMQQVVEIARAIARDSKILILDEPTSSLSESEARKLFEIIGKLKSQGISIIYVSHRMNEIFDLCDRVTVLRDGKLIKSMDIADTNMHDVVNLMVGREIEDIFPSKSRKISEPIMKVDGLQLRNVFENISFELRKGEILGIAGLVGAGRTEVLKSICGIDKHTRGTVNIHGKEMRFRSYRDAIDNGIVYLSEDRKEEGLFLNLDVSKNITVSSLKKVVSAGGINAKKEIGKTKKSVEQLDIKTERFDKAVNQLSGGNQQKVMLAKWLMCEPEIICLDEPTRGIDVGAKHEIYKIIRSLADEGIGVIVVSSEMTEIIGLCDRAIVMHEGEITGTVEGEEMTEKVIVRYASNI